MTKTRNSQVSVTWLRSSVLKRIWEKSQFGKGQKAQLFCRNKIFQTNFKWRAVFFVFFLFLSIKTTVIIIIGDLVPLNDPSTLRQRQRSMSSERADEGEGAEGMEGLEEPLRQSKPPLRQESRQGTRAYTL